MNVLGVVDYLENVGGAEISAETILTSLAEREGVDNVFAIGMAMTENPRLDYDGVDVYPVGAPRLLERTPDYVGDWVTARLLARKVQSLIGEVDADVVHAHHRRSTMALNRIDPPVPTVATVRDFWPICPISIYTIDCEQCDGCDSRLDNCIEYQGWDGLKAPLVRQYLLSKHAFNRSAATGVDAHVFIAEHIEETVSASLPIGERTVINNPVEVQEVGSAEPPTNPIFVTASTLSAEKGINTAVEAFRRFSEGRPQSRLDVYGDGPLRLELESQAQDCEGTVTFHGRVPVEEVYEAFASATAVLFPSKWNEPFGRVTVEAMAVGTPVVGTTVGGIAEVVENEETGLLVPPGTPVDLAAAMERLSSDPALVRRLGRMARQASDRYSPRQITEEHLRFYETLCRS